MQIVRGGRIFCFKQSAAPATLFAEARNIVRRGRSYAASLPSDSPKRKRVSKDERRAMIESFITRYRSVNAGKFPSASAAQKEVGGSYYVVRKVLQELEYNSKVCSSNSSFENLSGKVVNKEEKSFSEVQVVSTAVRVQNDTCTEAIDDVKMLDSDDKQLEAEGVLRVYSSEEETFSKGVLKPQTPGSHYDFVLEENIVLKDDAKSLEKQEDAKVEDAGKDSYDKFQIVPDKQKSVEVSDQHLESAEECKTESHGVQSDFVGVKGDLVKIETEVGHAEGDEKEQIASEELLNSGGPELKAEHHRQSSEEEKHARNFLSEQSDDAEFSKKSTLWGNLKSFADGIINMWRKL
ncbi:uncharacterized protein LOC110422567 [Herrania umbratica]|uniref:Uncharacterized protein LOC110422567 n=1 Tax=Herrania umbratica TaxID=108875 RepID=A0A6J1AZ05_9ROSI|nr:uncharacterized protein LOC110422567 [Herrania umbratica]